MRHGRADATQECAQALVAITGNVIRSPPLGFFETPAQFKRAMSFRPLVQREDHIRAQSRVQAHGLRNVTRIQPRRIRKASNRAINFSKHVPMKNKAPLNIR